MSEIASCDPNLFPYVQWCDGNQQPIGWSDSELITDALDDRLIPAQGELNALEFESLFDDTHSGYIKFPCDSGLRTRHQNSVGVVSSPFNFNVLLSLTWLMYFLCGE